MRKHTRSRYTPGVESIEARWLLSGLQPVAPPHHHPVPHAGQVHPQNHGVTIQGHHRHPKPHHPPAHHPGCNCGSPGGGGGGVGALPFNCAAKGIYNFAVVTITNVATTNVNFQVFAAPCPNSWINDALAPGQTKWYYTHFPSNLNPMFQVNLGGLNSFTPTPNILPGQVYPQFVFQITPAMGSQYQIVQTSLGQFALQRA